jgi:hypothetical protein
MTYTVIDIDATTRNGRNAVRAIVRELADDRAHDPYGSGMNALDAIVTTLWAAGEGVPSAIATEGAGGYDKDHPDVPDIMSGIESGEWTTDDVRYFMFVLSRFIDVVRVGGRGR